ncbi:MAG: H-X9-DG-CTERM domain-containing protein, partial [Planctomycetota bacterium]
NGGNVALADGSVRFLSDGVNADAVPDKQYPIGTAAPTRGGDLENAAGPLFRGLASRAGGEVLKGEF